MSDAYYLHLDESYRGNVLAVGGFICAAEELKGARDAWDAMREQMGIDYDEPVKWNYSQNNATRRRLDSSGWDNQARRGRRLLDRTTKRRSFLLAVVFAADLRSWDAYEFDYDLVREKAAWSGTWNAHRITLSARLLSDPRVRSVDLEAPPQVYWGALVE